MLDATVEALSATFHAIYQAEARRQGDVRHHDDYGQLTETTKEYDRVLARFILQHAPSWSIQAMLDDPLITKG